MMERRLKDAYFCYAIFQGDEFILSKNKETNESEWKLFSSLIYNDVQKAKEMNFRPLPIGDRYTVESYYLPITPTELDSAYSIENYCEYSGEVLECSFNGEKNEFGFDMRWVSKEICEKFGLAYEYERKVISRGIEDTGLVMSVPDSEIQDVWEIHKPIEGFPFKGPEKVWVKKDGVWLR